LIQINMTRTTACLPAFNQKEEHMKPLSEQLAELSARAKGAEDTFAGAKKEARDKIEARKAEALSAAKTAVETVNQQIKSAGESATRDTKALQAKITADANALKARVVEAKHGLDVKIAEKNAELLESDAGFAIDYAIASVEQARLAVLDAIDGRLAADQAKRS
jgi:signal transduction protein with GAF and PtsI domain